MPKREETWRPAVGTLVSFKLRPGDQDDIIPWLAAKGLKAGDISDFLRSVLRREAQREVAGVPVDMDDLVDKLASRLRALPLNREA